MRDHTVWTFHKNTVSSYDHCMRQICRNSMSWEVESCARVLVSFFSSIWNPEPCVRPKIWRVFLMFLSLDSSHLNWRPFVTANVLGNWLTKMVKLFKTPVPFRTKCSQESELLFNAAFHMMFWCQWSCPEVMGIVTVRRFFGIWLEGGREVIDVCQVNCCNAHYVTICAMARQASW